MRMLTIRFGSSGPGHPQNCKPESRVESAWQEALESENPQFRRRRPLLGHMCASVSCSTNTKRSLLALCLSGVALTASAGAAASPPEKPVRTTDLSGTVPGEVLVQFRAGVSGRQADRAVALQRSRVVGHIPFGISVVKLPPGISVARGLNKFRGDPRVAIAEPNLVLQERVPPNDPEFPFEWHLENTGQSHNLGDTRPGDIVTTHRGTTDADVDASTAWDTTQGDANTVIAIVDVGVDLDHPDLANQIWTNPDEVANGVDDDGNGKVDDLRGWDFVQNDNNPDPTLDNPGDDHGTFVAGVAAAEANNTQGVAGMCPLCKIMPLRVHTLSQWIQALAYARQKRASVVNMSIGTSHYSQLERNAIAAARNVFLLVVAADNSSLDNDMPLQDDRDGDGRPDVFSPAYPGVYTLPNILHVAASNDMDRHGYRTACFLNGVPRRFCSFTNWGHDSVDLSAPGVDIESTMLGGSYRFESGTSFASPLAAGIAGLVKSVHATYTPVQLRNVLMNTVDKPTPLRTMFSPLFASPATGGFTRTSGRVNAARAVAAPTTSTATRFAVTDGNVNGSRWMLGARVSGTLAFPGDVNDVWRKRLVAGRTYRVTMNGKDLQDFDLWIWKPQTIEIFQTFKRCPSCKLLAARTTISRSNVETLRFRAGKTGVYYFQVEAWLKKAGGYSLAVRRV